MRKKGSYLPGFMIPEMNVNEFNGKKYEKND